MSDDRGKDAASADLDATFERDKERLYALCLRLTGRHEEAEDALQDTWLAARSSIAKFRGDASLSTWLYRIAIRSATRVRAQRRTATLEREPESRTRDDEESREKLRRLLRALDELGLEQRTVLALSAIEGLGATAIAEVLGVPEGTVWSRLSLARQSLRRAIAAGDTPPRD
jgi:RNA polymerase sigma-70 factor, ECF subfamily